MSGSFGKMTCSLGDHDNNGIMYRVAKRHRMPYLNWSFDQFNLVNYLNWSFQFGQLFELVI